MSKFVKAFVETMNCGEAVSLGEVNGNKLYPDSMSDRTLSLTSRASAVPFARQKQSTFSMAFRETRRTLQFW